MATNVDALIAVLNIILEYLLPSCLSQVPESMPAVIQTRYPLLSEKIVLGSQFFRCLLIWEEFSQLTYIRPFSYVKISHAQTFGR